MVVWVEPGVAAWESEIAVVFKEVATVWLLDGRVVVRAAGLNQRLRRPL